MTGWSPGWPPGRGVLEAGPPGCLQIAELKPGGKTHDCRRSGNVFGPGHCLIRPRLPTSRRWLGIPAEIGPNPARGWSGAALLLPRGSGVTALSRHRPAPKPPASLQLELQPPLLSELRSPSSSLPLKNFFPPPPRKKKPPPGPCCCKESHRPERNRVSPRQRAARSVRLVSEQDRLRAEAVATEFRALARLLAPLAARKACFGLAGPFRLVTVTIRALALGRAGQRLVAGNEHANSASARPAPTLAQRDG